MVFQMPSTFSRKAGRWPRVLTASRKLFGKVSATVKIGGSAADILHDFGGFAAAAGE
jgi:hypothetical protein